MRPILLLSLLTVAACAVNPATGRREISLVSESQEIEMGREADPQITASLGLVDDPALQAYVSDLGARVAAVSERPSLPWSFKVVDDPVVNAFALPGGFIYVTRGILAHFDTEAELVGVLGHEVGHVTARHSASQMSRQQLQQIGLGAGMIFSERVRSVGGVLGAGLGLMNLSFSRGDESQSDELGLRYMSRIGYDGSALIGVFRMLAEASGGAGGRAPEWQLTHPYPENREENIRRLLAAAGGGGGTVGRDEYLDRIDGLVYGVNPREGFFSDARFIHPALEFEITFPDGWRGINQKQAVISVAPSEEAVVILSIAPDASDAGTALRTFLGQQGVSGGRVNQESRGGVERARATFRASTSDGDLRGEVAYMEHGEAVYQVLGYASPRAWPGYQDLVARALDSFEPLTDTDLLSIQPWRLDIVTIPRSMSLADFAERYPGPATLDQLARLNGLGANEIAPEGTRMKRVIGEPYR